MESDWCKLNLSPGINGIIEGLRKELPSMSGIPVRRLDGCGDFDHILEVVRRFLRDHDDGARG